MSELEDLLKLDEQGQLKERSLRQLLDEHRRQDGHLLGLTSQMGAARAYVTSATLEWVASKVGFAAQLPMFKPHADESAQTIKITRETAAEVQQRRPDWSRQYEMALYLASRKTRKFPPILVVVWQAWVDNPEGDEWGANGRALSDSIDAISLDSKGNYFDITIDSDDLLYAIDGQHRLMAIQGLAEFVKNGSLGLRGKDYTPRKKMKTVDEVIAESKGQVSHSDLQQSLSEHMGIELIPAVCLGETREEAVRRLRTVFVHVNKTAKRLSGGELALLDEDNGFAVVARRVMVSHDLLREKTKIEKGQLSDSAREVTTLETLVSMATAYLCQLKDYDDWRPEIGLAIRPNDDALDRGTDAFSDLIDVLARLASFDKVINGASSAEYRVTAEGGPGNLLFRPLAQHAWAEAVGSLVSNETNPMTLAAIGKTLVSADASGHLKISDPHQPWYGAVWEPSGEEVGIGKMQKKEASRYLCARLLFHLIGNGTPSNEARQQLEEDFAESRVFDEVKGRARDLKNKEVPKGEVTLPRPW